MNEVPSAVAGAVGVPEGDVRVHVVELDQGGGGPFVVVYAAGLADARAMAAIAAAVADAQGVETADVVVRWVVAG